MKKILVCLCIVWSINSSAQTRFIIEFTDKATNPYSLSDPGSFLSQRSIERRTKYSIGYDSTDLPVTPRYLDSLMFSGEVYILNVSKWLNSVSIQTTDNEALDRIQEFPFVKNVRGIAAKTANLDVQPKFNKGYPLANAREMGITTDHFEYGFSSDQVRMHNGQFLHNIGLRGQQMVIGMLDAGYQNYLTVKAFDSVRINSQFLDIYDFVDKDYSVNEDHFHGLHCLSTMAANIPGEFVGTAPKSSFYLFRTEDASSEYPIEMHNWVCGAEKLDSAGGDVISSSLGYNTFNAPLQNFNYSYSDMDGNTTIAAIGADLAARKGILVINSAGNEGNSGWGRILTPADGDSVLTVGAVYADSVPAGFTSRGPTADGRIKPDVVSLGVNTTVQLQNNNIGTNSGTSLATPNLAGLITCLWQGFPEFNNMKIIDATRRSAHRFNDPNDTIGYGIPDMKKAFMLLVKDFSTASGSSFNCLAILNWKSKDTRNMRYEIERKLPGQSSFQKIFETFGTTPELSIKDYQFTDNLTDLPSGLIVYRIRQVIDTNSNGFYADYIDTVNVVSNMNCVTSNMVTLMPNPTKGPFTIKVSVTNAAPDLQIRIFNSKGQLVYSAKRSQTAGTSFYEIPLHHLAAGKYYISVFTGGQLLETKELVKL